MGETRRQWIVAFLAVVVLAVVATAAPPVATAQPVSGAALPCEGDDGAVFVTDSGLVVVHDGRALVEDPYANETTLTFPNVTVEAESSASVDVVEATGDGICAADVRPDASPIVLSPAAGPQMTVSDPVDGLTYGSVDYADSETSGDVAYDAPSFVDIEIDAASLQPGDVVEAVDVDDGAIVASGTVTDDETIELRLPAGATTLDLRYAETETPTDTAGTGSGPDGSVSTPAGTVPTGTETETPGLRYNQTETPDLRHTETGTPDLRTTETETPTGTAGTGSGPDGSVSTPVGTVPTETKTETETPVADVTNAGFDRGSGVIDYELSPQTQHVGGFLPLAVLLWLLACWLLIVRDSDGTTLLALVLVFAAFRTTSDLFQVLFDGVGASVATINLLLDLSIALLFVQFAANYAEETWLRTRKVKLALGGVATVGAVSVLTNPVHGFVFAEIAVAEAPFSYVATSLGPAGWLLYAVDFVLLIGGGWLILRSLLERSTPAVWRPVAVVGGGLCLAILIGVVDALGFGPIADYDYTAVGVNYFLLATSVTLLRYGLERLSTSGKRSVVSDLSDPVFILDDDWSLVTWNPMAERLLPGVEAGTSLDSVLDHRLDRPTLGETVTAELSLAVRSVATDGGEVKPDTSPTPSPVTVTDSTDRDPSAETESHFVASVTPVATDTGAIIGYAVRLADVTTLKSKLVKLSRKNAQLDQFADAITHDLRDPLSVADRQTDVALRIARSTSGSEPIDRAGLAECLDVIDAALERIGGIIDDVLALARGTDGRADLQQVEFAAVVDSALESARADSEAVVLETGGEIVADPTHLERILVQLFDNAFDHGGEDATVRVGLAEEGFYVADDGPGVPEEVRDGLFESGVTTVDGRSGLGLAVASGRAAAQGWAIDLDECETGARFVITGCDTKPVQPSGGEAR